MNPLPPAADFSAAPTVGFVPLNVQFTDKSSPYISSWHWEFGPGGSTSALKNPYFIYNVAGNWTVNLTVKNKAGESTLSKTNYIIVTRKPVSRFTASNTPGIGSMLMHFVDQSTDATSWHWDFGDGTTSTMQNPEHRYNISGDFSVTLTASNIGGNGDPFRTNFRRGNDTIPIVSPAAEFSMNSSEGTTPLTIQFNDHSTGTPSPTYQWNFGDGSQNSTEKNPVHTFTATANMTYNITLTASNSAGISSKSAIIKVDVKPPVIAPVANFTASSGSEFSPLSVRFNDTSTGSQLLIYQWNLGMVVSIVLRQIRSMCSRQARIRHLLLLRL
jgi:PKD repeat protein